MQKTFEVCERCEHPVVGRQQLDRVEVIVHTTDEKGQQLMGVDAELDVNSLMCGKCRKRLFHFLLRSLSSKNFLDVIRDGGA